MKILKSLFFASAVYGFCEETLIGEEPVRPGPDNSGYSGRLTQSCVNKDDEFEIRVQLECKFDLIEDFGPYGGYVLEGSSVFDIFTVYGRHFLVGSGENFTEEPQIVPKLRSFGNSMAYLDDTEWFNGYGVASSDGKGITREDCVDGEFLDIKMTQTRNTELNRWERELYVNNELIVRRSNRMYYQGGALSFELGADSWSGRGTVPLALKNLIVKNLAPPTPPPPPPVCTGFEMIPLDLKANWKDAKKACRALGAELAFFNNEEEFELYKSTREGLARNDWLGIRKNKRGTKFITVWRQRVPFTNFDEDSDESYQGCVEILESNKWNNADCEEQRGVTCRVRSNQYC